MDSIQCWRFKTPTIVNHKEWNCPIWIQTIEILDWNCQTADYISNQQDISTIIWIYLLHPFVKRFSSNGTIITVTLLLWLLWMAMWLFNKSIIAVAISCKFQLDMTIQWSITEFHLICEYPIYSPSRVRVHLIFVIMHRGWARITRVSILTVRKKIYHHKQMSGIFFCTWPPRHTKKKTWNDATVCCRTPVYFMQCAPIRRMTQAVGMNQPFGGLIWSQTSYQPSYMWHTRVSLMKADPRSEPGGVVALLNRKWTRSNAPIRLRCGETKHHHPTGRK